jgi:hypothetical protein
LLPIGISRRLAPMLPKHALVVPLACGTALVVAAVA